MRSILFSVLILTVTTSYCQQAEPLLFSEKVHDYGEINEADGTADYQFFFTNNAGRAIKVLSVQPSCGCTTPDWSKEPIAPGSTGFIKVSFDPRGKPGYFNKSLSVVTDVSSASIYLQIKGQVVPASRRPEDIFTAENGNLRLKSNSFNVGRVFINQNATSSEFEIYNSGKRTIRFTGKAVTPAHIKIYLPDSILPLQKKKFRLEYNAKAKDQYGFVSDNVELVTDDEQGERKFFSVYATIEEYFPALSVDEKATAPVLQPQFTTVDLGRARPGQILKGEVRIKNTGKKELVIHAVQPNCVCVTLQTEKMKLKGGEETKILLGFDGQGRLGTQQKAITIYSNDPRSPVQRITLTAYMED